MLVFRCRLDVWSGRLAQLGERCIHIAEVTGSNPVSPTNSLSICVVLIAALLRKAVIQLVRFDVAANDPKVTFVVSNLGPI